MQAFRQSFSNGSFEDEHTIFLVYNHSNTFKVKTYFSYTTTKSNKIQKDSFCRLTSRINTEINPINMVEVSLDTYIELYKKLCSQEINFVTLFK